MTVSNGDIVKVILEYVYPGASTALNIFHYVYSGASSTDEDTLDALETWFTADWADTWADLAPSTASVDNLKAQIVSAAGVVLRDLGTAVIGVPGILGSEVNPGAVSGYLMANTASPQIRGSKYVPGISEGAIVAGLFSAPAVLDLGLLLVDYLANITIITGERLLPGCLSTKTGGFVTFTDSGLINSTPAYQRRRKPGVGI